MKVVERNEIFKTNYPFCFVSAYSIERSFEADLVSNWFYKTNRAMISLIERNIKLYRSLEEYTDDLSLQALRSDRSVKLENLSRAFVFYVIVLALLLIWFITEWYLPKAKKFLDIVYFKIRLAAIKQFEKMRKKISRFSLKHLLQNFLENLFRKETKNQNSTIRESTETVK